MTILQNKVYYQCAIYHLSILHFGVQLSSINISVAPVHFHIYKNKQLTIMKWIYYS
jgi:hypothetical protein